MKKVNLITSIYFVLLILLLSQISSAEEIKLNESYPNNYTVVKGDTLWDISGKFLQNPWQWPDIWEINQQIKNPHLIYPGDELLLVFVNGQPKIRRIGKGQRPTYKLSPTKRIETLNLAIPTIELEKIAPFFSGNRIVEKGELSQAPYVVGTSEDHLIAAKGYEIYVNNIPKKENNEHYGIYYRGQTYFNPNDTSDILGYEAIYLGEGNIIRKGQPSTLIVTKSKAEILNSSRLLKLNDDEFNSNFMPKPAQTRKVGEIVGSLTSGIQAAVNNVGVADVVLINFGTIDKTQVGDVYNIYNKGKYIPDPVVTKGKVRLPNEFAGNMIVFKVFNKISYAIIMDAQKVIKKGDIVVSPYMIQK